MWSCNCEYFWAGLSYVRSVCCCWIRHEDSKETDPMTFSKFASLLDTGAFALTSMQTGCKEALLHQTASSWKCLSWRFFQ